MRKVKGLDAAKKWLAKGELVSRKELLSIVSDG
jgi:hypothetical protein